MPRASAANDPLQSRQWGLAKIHAPRAWTQALGGGVIVGVIDTGVDATHEDLIGRVLPGRDFVDDDADASDEHGHGTLVAGIIAASRGNGLGGSGVAPRAKILPVRALDEDGRGEPEAVSAAIRWTVEQGAQVINLSLTVDRSDASVFSGLFTDRQVEAAIEDAADAGVLVLIASGNDPQGGQNETSYDATRDEVLVIGASTSDDRLAAYSNHGTGLDLLAPGGGSASEAGNQGCKADNWIVSTWWTRSGGSKYGATCGTSMATAFASGLGALLRGEGLTAIEASQRMRATARDLGAEGVDGASGSGRIDAAAAVGVAPEPTSTARTSPTPVSPSQTPQGSVSHAGGTPTSVTTAPGTGASSRPSDIEASPRASDGVAAVPPFDAEPTPAKDPPYGFIVAAVVLASGAAVSVRGARVRKAAARTAATSPSAGMPPSWDPANPSDPWDPPRTTEDA